VKGEVLLADQVSFHPALSSLMSTSAARSRHELPSCQLQEGDIGPCEVASSQRASRERRCNLTYKRACRL
jgi:hypothetical protein